MASKRDLPPAFELASAPWLIVATATDQDRVQELREDLDPGEAEAIALAIGRRAATAAGLTVTGLLGVVARAKRAGLIDLAKPVLDELIQIARFWIGPELYGEVLAKGGRGPEAAPGNQKNSFSTNWIWRLVENRVELTRPACGVPMVLPGALNCGRLKALKKSARYCRL